MRNISSPSVNPIKVIHLYGSKHEMGIQYGHHLKNDLLISFHIIQNYFIEQGGLSIERLTKKAELLFSKYPYSYQKFLEGISTGSSIDIDKIKILNAMETLNALLREKQEIAACTFVSVPYGITASNGTLIGRNYDFHGPFKEIAKFLTLTVMHETDCVPTAFISMPGQIYCPSCINQAGLFVEFNNGTPSGGRSTNNERETLLINLLNIVQNSNSLDQLNKQLLSVQSDYSLIVNIASKDEVKSYEYSSYHGMKPFTPPLYNIHVSTNFYLNETWAINEPSDDLTWLGVTRRNNMLNLLDSKNKVHHDEMMQALDLNIAEQGATWNYTIYQIVYDAGDEMLFLKRTDYDNTWQEFDLHNLFITQLQSPYLEL
ncbi:MAG: C45 family autoproteolytic acyltransferase/hydrolase [Proteobacteria bacterium]|nr:C45 family autoproteolytic acyltransferase/hydrolase [Pseudomonadota bacterium]